MLLFRHSLTSTAWPAAGPGGARTDGQLRIGSSAAIRAVRDRIERVAATDFTVLIEGAFGPQPHPGFIDFSCEAAVCDGDGEVEGAGAAGLVGSLTRPHLFSAPAARRTSPRYGIEMSELAGRGPGIFDLLNRGSAGPRAIIRQPQRQRRRKRAPGGPEPPCALQRASRFSRALVNLPWLTDGEATGCRAENPDVRRDRRYRCGHGLETFPALTERRLECAMVGGSVT